jgi:hypothetical protein
MCSDTWPTSIELDRWQAAFANGPGQMFSAVAAGEVAKRERNGIGCLD